MFRENFLSSFSTLSLHEYGHIMLMASSRGSPGIWRIEMISFLKTWSLLSFFLSAEILLPAQLIQEKIWCISSCKLPRLIDIRSSLKPCSLGRHWLARKKIESNEEMRCWAFWKFIEIRPRRSRGRTWQFVFKTTMDFFVRQNYSSLKTL